MPCSESRRSLLTCVEKTFELLTGLWCFDPEQKGTASLDAHHLALLIALTGETFPLTMLERAQRRDEFFTPEG